MVPFAERAAMVRFPLISPADGLRSAATGRGEPGKTVRNVFTVGFTAVMLTTTSLASAGVAANCATFTTRVVAGPIVLPTHWNSVPDRVDGFPSLVSQMRMGGPTDV